MIRYKSYTLPLVSLLLTAGLLGGCNDDDSSDNNMRSYEIKLVNLTANQPLSPPAIIVHGADYRAFSDGEPASAGLEILAEGGDNSSLLSEAQAASSYISSLAASQAIGPGGMETYQLTVENGSHVHLSLLSMLVNTNDGFTAVNGLNIAGLETQQTQTVNLPVWDAGTEANTEAAGTIPGPADGGEGFNAHRDDNVDFVSFHPGVISADDGLNGSVLNESHRFDNPAARISITRTH
ncbi:MAG: spondin domain-containing protein [Thiolinea sp.]